MNNDPNNLNVFGAGAFINTPTSTRVAGGGAGGGGGGRGVDTDPRMGSDGKLGVFWIGTDGNVWTKDNLGTYTNMGPAAGKTEADMAQWRQIADWNQPATTGTGGGSTTTSKTTYPDLTGAISILRENIKGLDPIYEAALKKAEQDYNIANAERQSAYDATKAASETSDITNQQNVLNARNAINKNARMSSEDILSILGALGMTGSTTNKALSTIADKSNENLNASNYQYGKNAQSILQAWNDYVNADVNKQKQLTDTKAYDVAQAGIDRATKRKDYLGQIASNMVNMGQFDTSGIQGEIAGANAEIGGLSKVPRSYTGVTPTYTAPSIGTILGQNMSRFDIQAGNKAGKSQPKLVKVNEQTGTGEKYGLV